MKITNKLNLPESFVKLVSNNYPPKENQISCTGLIDPPLIRLLTKNNWDEIEEDASDRVWAVLGQACHYMLDSKHHPNSLSEEKLSVDIEGIKLVGKPDLLDSEGTLWDYKITSVWSIVYGKQEWDKQLNVYRYLYEKHGFKINKLKILAILRDWSKRKVDEGGDYPSANIIIKDITMWGLAFTEDYIFNRLRLHMTTSLENAICSAEEKWQKENSWAVKKKGGKRAIRVFEKENEAKKFMGDSKILEIEHRKGEAVRCKDYCLVSKFCNKKEGLIC